MIYVGGYSSQGGPGIAVLGRTLYAVHELPQGLVSAFAGGGGLCLLGTQPTCVVPT